MSKLVFSVMSWTPAATADNSNLADNTHQSIQGASATQRTAVSEVYVGGLGGASTPSVMTLARDSTIGATLTALTTGQNVGPHDPDSAALAAPVACFVAATTKPIRSNVTTLGRLNFSMNAYGSVVRWQAYPGEEFWIKGNAASLGEASLSAFTGGTPGLLGSHIIFEST